MKVSLRLSTLIVPLSMFLAIGTARGETIQATLTGYEENPPVSTLASGEFRGQISRNNDAIDYVLTYSGIQGNVTQAHIHFGQLSVNGSIVIWLCRTTQTAPVGTPDCTSPSGTFTGRITAASVVDAATTSQQLTAGELDEVIAAIRAGAAYVNVHSSLSTGGEIRGQIRASRKR
jgi:CHRD domain-containing protein